MRAIEIREPGGPEVLVPTDAPTPEPGPADVLIKVAAAGVNRPDVLQRIGVYPPPPGASPLPGLEVAGEIVAVGSQVVGLAVGETVCALLGGGGYAEYAAASAALCLPIPEGVSVIDAAGLPEATFTAWHNLVDHGRMTSGQNVLIHGGTSGVGVMAIQIAKAAGAHVITTVGSEEKAKRARELGAEIVVNYREADFAEAAKAMGGVDVVLDMVGGDYVARTLPVMNEEAHYVFIAFLGGAKAELDIIQVMRKRLVVTGSTLRSRNLEAKAALARAVRQKVWPWFADGRMRPVTERTFPLEQACDAHAAMEAGGHVGKFILTLD